MKPAPAFIACLTPAAFLLVAAAAVAGPADAQASDAAAINRVFADIHMVIDGLMGLIEPIGALMLAAALLMQKKILSNQKLATADRVETKAILVAQNDTLATMHAAVVPAPAPTDPEKTP